MHAEEAHVDAVDFLEGEQGLRPVRELRKHFAIFDESTSHARFNFDDLVRAGHDSDVHLASAGFLLLACRVVLFVQTFVESYFVL